MEYKKNTLYIFADGACRNNQEKDNLGGYAAVLRYNDEFAEHYAVDKNTTNNKMELCAILLALGKVKDKSKPTIVTMDSQYIVKGINEWSAKWKKSGFKNAKGEEIKNFGYWRWLLDVVDTFDNIQFIHCKGHEDNEGNNRADELCNIAMDEYLAKKGKI